MRLPWKEARDISTWLASVEDLVQNFCAAICGIIIPHPKTLDPTGISDHIPPPNRTDPQIPC